MRKIEPYAPATPEYYSRLFPPTAPPFDLKVMDSLGLEMKAPHGKPTATLPAGYTYFGQFVDHDITRDDTLLECAGKKQPDETINLFGPWLDLNQLYGNGPGSANHKNLYDEAGAFVLGGNPLWNGQVFDVLLDDAKKPLLADDRSNENLIIRQLHVMFLKLHNLAIDGFSFEQAREKVRWQYQWLIRNDYLKKICHDEVYDDVVRKGNRVIDWEKDAFSIPVEFSQAAFRFGHSMVRDDYKLNKDKIHFPLSQLFAETRTGKNIPIELAIDWKHFMNNERSMAIDTLIVPTLYNLRDHFHHLLTCSAPPQPPELPIRTLRRGAMTGLPTGEEVSCALGYPQLRSISMKACSDRWAMLDELGLAGRTPLWFYVLLEAECSAEGEKLGYVGSRIVAEVIEGSLRADDESFLNKCGPKWEPPLWKSWDKQERSIKQLSDIPKVVGLLPASG